MFISDGRLPHLLKPSDYCSQEQHERECEILLAEAWHFVGTSDDFKSPGSFITANLCGKAVQIRNVTGELVAFSNVCSHRHCLLTDKPQGHSEKIVCQYHGWEYDSDGKTRRIPQPKNFTPLDHESLRLATYRVEQCGKLVFVCLSDRAGNLEEFLGELYSTCKERFGTAWQCFLNWDPVYQVNWKIPIENSLEAYHVPSVHPDTFREDPGELRCNHQLEDRHTAMTTQLPFCPQSRFDAWFQSFENRFVSWLHKTPQGEYQQHHIFPNLMFSFTDAISLCHAVLPTEPTASRGVVRQFGLVGKEVGWIRHAGASFWGRLKAAITRKVLTEDMELFPAIQAGLASSEQPGVLGRCEERIHRFQEYIVAKR